MANWQRELDLSGFFDQAREGEISLKELATIASERLMALRPLGDETLDLEREDIADDFARLEDDATKDEFDEAMERLYDWADTALDDKWNGRKVCWVRTF